MGRDRSRRTLSRGSTTLSGRVQYCSAELKIKIMDHIPCERPGLDCVGVGNGVLSDGNPVGPDGLIEETTRLFGNAHSFSHCLRLFPCGSDFPNWLIRQLPGKRFETRLEFENEHFLVLQRLPGIFETHRDSGCCATRSKTPWGYTSRRLESFRLNSRFLNGNRPNSSGLVPLSLAVDRSLVARPSFVKPHSESLKSQHL